MARVTVEDCIEKVPNRYELLMIAAQRAKDIEQGSPLRVDRNNDKNPVVALREIAEDKVSIDVAQQRPDGQPGDSHGRFDDAYVRGHLPRDRPAQARLYYAAACAHNLLRALRHPVRAA